MIKLVNQLIQQIFKDLKRNEKVEYLTKEIEKRTNQLQKNSMRLLNV